MTDQPIVSVFDHKEVRDDNGQYVEYSKVDLAPCPRCGALTWFTTDDWWTRGIVRCGDCNHHAPWQEVADVIRGA